MTNSGHLCSPAELDRLLCEPGLRVLDCSWYLPQQQIDSRQAYRDQHIPGAGFFDIDRVCDQHCELPHMLPPPESFALAVSELGVDNQSEVVVYDSAGIFSAARVWWMFHVFGHSRVRVLNGGLPAWEAYGGAFDAAASSPEPAATRLATATAKTKFEARLNSRMVATKADLIANADTQSAVILDARSRLRFAGQAPEPRPGLPSGHMPHSISLPYDWLLDSGKLKSRRELRTIFGSLGVTRKTSIVTSCGSGVTAAIITLALAESGFGMHRLYDGAWAEWASAVDTIVLTAG